MRCYLYIARRDRKGARVIMVLDAPQINPTRVTDLKSIQLPAIVQDSVEQIIDENRMYWEPWIESAENYEELKLSLDKRGYRNLYVSSKPLYDGSSILSPPIANMSKHPSRKKMLSKGEQ